MPEARANRPTKAGVICIIVEALDGSFQNPGQPKQVADNNGSEMAGLNEHAVCFAPVYIY